MLSVSEIHFILEARLLSTVPDNRGPILDKVVKRKLYKCATEIMVPVKQLLSYNLKDIGYQIMEERSKIEEETEDYSNNDDGPFNNVPREIIFQIFSYLDLYSLGMYEKYQIMTMLLKHIISYQGIFDCFILIFYSSPMLPSI